MRSIVFDVTELVQNPVRTGIQRVVREILRHWPDPAHVRLARFTEPHGLVSVPDQALPLLIEANEEIRTNSIDVVKARIDERLDETASPLGEDSLVFVPEVFFDNSRCAYYRNLLKNKSRAAAFLVYDLIPWLYPDHIGVRRAAPLMPYLTLLRDAPNTAFISGRTKEEYVTRIRREGGHPGPVFPLGGDGLSLERQTFRPEREGFAIVGSIDGRKNQDKVVAAFEGLWSKGLQVPLTIIGNAFPHVDRGFLDRVRQNPNFTWLSGSSDEMIRVTLRKVRATLYVSELEGYGIPPVESLHAGVPVIATEHVPSLLDLPSGGQIRLSSTEPDDIAAAVLKMLDDDTASQLWREAFAVPVPTWRECAGQVAGWLRRCLVP